MNYGKGALRLAPIEKHWIDRYGSESGAERRSNAHLETEGSADSVEIRMAPISSIKEPLYGEQLLKQRK